MMICLRLNLVLMIYSFLLGKLDLYILSYLDTDGNLSEVKVGQEVWVSNKTINRIWEAKIIGLDKNLGIFLRYINHEYKGHITTPNITGKESFLKVTTNKPHRDFSDCPIGRMVLWGAVLGEGVERWKYAWHTICFR